MKSFRTSIIYLFFFPLFVCAQPPVENFAQARNSFFFELLGSADLYSVRYDRIIYKRNLLKLSGNVGLSYLPPSLGYSHVFNYPVQFNVLFGNQINLVMGVGTNSRVALYPDDILKIYDLITYPMVHLGYRYQATDGGFFAGTNVYFYPLNSPYKNYYLNESKVSLWLGLQVGFTFSKMNKNR